MEKLVSKIMRVIWLFVNIFQIVEAPSKKTPTPIKIILLGDFVCYELSIWIKKSQIDKSLTVDTPDRDFEEIAFRARAMFEWTAVGSPGGIGHSLASRGCGIEVVEGGGRG